jgi:uncharacterized membrane protein
MPENIFFSVSNLRKIARLCASGVFAIGMMVLVGWILKIPLLKSVLPGFVEMKANTAIGYIFSGISLWCLCSEKRSGVVTKLGYFSALIITILGGLTLFEYLLNINFGIDLLLFYEAPGAIGTSDPGRMAPQSALSFVLKGVALLTLHWETKRGHRPSQYLSLITALFPIQALTAYAYGVRTLLGTGDYKLVTQMAVHAAVAWLLLSVGTLCAVPDRGIMKLVTDKSYAGTTVRRLLLPGLIIPVVLGFILTIGFRKGTYDAGFGFSTMALGSVIAYSILVWLNAKKLFRMEKDYNADKENSENQIRQLQKMEAVGRLAGGVAHDFNNILAIIGMYGETVFDGLEEGHPLKANAEQVKKAVGRGASLTRQLLAFSRQQVVQPKPLNFNQVIGDFQKMLRRLIGENIELVMEFDENLGTIVADEGQMEQIVMNLVVNARDAMPQGGKISRTSFESLLRDLSISMFSRVKLLLHRVGWIIPFLWR